MATRTASEPRSGCPINAAMEVIGDRWPLLVLRDVMFGNRRHFRVLEESLEEGIASNILADRLRRLVSGRAAHAGGRRPRSARDLRPHRGGDRAGPAAGPARRVGPAQPPTTRMQRVRAELLVDGGPALWEDFMAELRSEHLGASLPKRSYGTGQLYVVKGARGRETWYGRWRTGERKINRRIGGKRATGTRMGLTRAQAERKLQRLIDHLDSLGRKRSTIEEYRFLPAGPSRAFLRRHGARQDHA
jgi:hypothetical protein